MHRLDLDRESPRFGRADLPRHPGLWLCLEWLVARRIDVWQTNTVFVEKTEASECECSCCSLTESCAFRLRLTEVWTLCPGRPARLIVGCVRRRANGCRCASIFAVASWPPPTCSPICGTSPRYIGSSLFHSTFFFLLLSLDCWASAAAVHLVIQSEAFC